jgi:hypothetical protein
MQVGLNEDDYFAVGDENDLCRKIIQKLSFERVRDYREILVRKFNWDNIALATIDVYKNLVSVNEVNSVKNRLR